MGGAGLRGAHTEGRCAGVVDGAGVAGGEMGEDLVDDLASLDAGNDAQRAATHTTGFDVDVEDALALGLPLRNFVAGPVGAALWRGRRVRSIRLAIRPTRGSAGLASPDGS